LKTKTTFFNDKELDKLAQHKKIAKMEEVRVKIAAVDDLTNFFGIEK